MKPFLSVLALAGGLACGSSESGTTPTSRSCGTGDAVAYQGDTYCVFGSGLIIEGFMCPEAYPYPFAGEGGAKLCAGKSGLPAELVTKVMSEWKSDDDGGSDVTDSPDTLIGGPDIASPDVGQDPPSQQTVTVPSGAPNGDWCAQMYEGAKVGDELLVIDWTCPVSKLCGEGVVMGCASFGRDYHCRCVEGNQHCEDVGPVGTTSCPIVGSAVGDACGAFLETKACADGAYCKVAAAGDMWGTCTALTAKCADERSCHADSDCAAATATAGKPTRCYGGDALTNTLGTCRVLPTLPACVGDRDCPYEFHCEGATLGCPDACSCDGASVIDVAGQCVKTTGFSDLNLWVEPGHKVSGDVVVPFWNKGAIGDASDWISCPSYEVQVEDPKDGWVTVAKELCEDEGNLTEIAPGTILARPGFTVQASTPGSPGRFRLRGTYYYGCEGKTGPSQCEGGPYERFTPATYIVD